jgi:MFS family permease
VPWHFKFLIGIGMDAAPSIGTWRRRTYIVMGTFITMIGVLKLAGTTDVWLGILPAIILFMGGDALIDTGMDSLLLDVTPPDWHGTGIGVGWGARAIGYTISLVLTLFVQSAFGWNAVLYLFALYALPALIAVEIREPKTTEERRIAKRPLADTFTDRRMLGWVAFAFFGAFVYVLDPTRGFLALVISSVAGPAEQFVLYAAICFGIGAAASSFATGRLIDRIGHRKGYYISLAMAFASVISWTLLSPGMLLLLLLLSFLLGFFSAFNIVSWFSVLADTVPPNFTAFMWQYDMGWLHVAAFVTGIFISHVVVAGAGTAMIGLALIMLLGFLPAKFIRSINASKGEVS